MGCNFCNCNAVTTQPCQKWPRNHPNDVYAIELPPWRSSCAWRRCSLRPSSGSARGSSCRRGAWWARRPSGPWSSPWCGRVSCVRARCGGNSIGINNRLKSCPKNCPGSNSWVTLFFQKKKHSFRPKIRNRGPNLVPYFAFFEKIGPHFKREPLKNSPQGSNWQIYLY